MLCGSLSLEIDSVNPLVALCLAFLNIRAFPGEDAQGITANNIQPLTAVSIAGLA